MQKNEEIHYINVVKCWISQLYYHNMQFPWLHVHQSS